jgi:hypothetical protein
MYSSNPNPIPTSTHAESRDNRDRKGYPKFDSAAHCSSLGPDRGSAEYGFLIIITFPFAAQK